MKDAATWTSAARQKITAKVIARLGLPPKKGTEGDQAAGKDQRKIQPVEHAVDRAGHGICRGLIHDEIDDGAHNGQTRGDQRKIEAGFSVFEQVFHLTPPSSLP